MPNIPEKLVAMIREVARALGDEMLSQIAFVGGCTTGLLMTDPITRESVRYTQDVDLIIDIFGYPAWTRLQSQLRDIGFQESMDEGAICRMYLGELKVDFMHLVAKFQKTTSPPTKTNILRWLKEIHREIRLTYFADSASYLVAIPNPEGQLIIFHAGDCLLGRVIKDTKIQWLTEPHTLVNATKSVPHDDLAQDPDRNILTRSFRGWKFIEPEFNCIFTTPAEKIIIASDGFWADLSRENQLALITESSEPIDPRDDTSFLLFSNLAPTVDPNRRC